MRDAGVNFTLDIYGAGSLSYAIASGIAGAGLGDRVRLHAPVDFDSVLVPAMRRDADVFLSCHRQGDPSCSYLEAMGCGLPVVGFANRMLAALVADSGGGWCVPMGDLSAMAALIGGLQKGIEVLNPGNTLAAQTFMILFIIVFIQFRPRGIIPQRGRAAAA